MPHAANVSACGASSCDRGSDLIVKSNILGAVVKISKRFLTTIFAGCHALTVPGKACLHPFKHPPKTLLAEDGQAVAPGRYPPTEPRP